tara:strand:- start:73 stop:315 length:243 start_codon:yes stop_codon:yes gene_type:complete
VELNLDDGSTTKLKQFDVVIQRATNHEWVCLDEKPALACAVLVDTPVVGDESYGELSAKNQNERKNKSNNNNILRVVCNI